MRAYIVRCFKSDNYFIIEVKNILQLYNINKKNKKKNRFFFIFFSKKTLSPLLTTLRELIRIQNKTKSRSI